MFSFNVYEGNKDARVNLQWLNKRSFTEIEYYPATLKERYGEEKDGWINKLYYGDNLQVMSHLLKKYRGKVNLIYIDPPFNSNADYKSKVYLHGVGYTDNSYYEEKQYGDIWKDNDYLQFMYERLILCRELLSDTGSIYVHMDEERVHYIKAIMDEVFGGSNFRREIVWDITVLSGFKVSAMNWIRGHDIILYYSKSASCYFNKLRQPHSQDYIDMFNHVDDNGERYMVAHGLTRYLRDVIDKGKPFGDVWDDLTSYQVLRKQLLDVRNVEQLRDILSEEKTVQNISNVWNNIMSFQQQPTSSENVKYPTQKPEALLERIIKASSNPGDIIFDCFMGSGTTQAVAMKLGRKFLGADINLGSIQTTTKRLISRAKELNNISDSKTDITYYTGFEVYHVNECKEDNILNADTSFNIFRDQPNVEIKIENENNQKVLKIVDFKSYYLLSKFELDTNFDFRSFIDSVYIDWDYENDIFRCCLSDITRNKKQVIEGIYEIPEYASTICVKIIDISGNTTTKQL